MLKRIHVPNLFVLVGQPDNGKTTCSNWFGKILNCDVLHTDQIYQTWIAANHPNQVRYAKRNIRGHYPTLHADIKLAWNQYITQVIIAAVKRARLDVVVEGWLLLHLPEDLKATLYKRATTMFIHMRRFSANAHDKTFKPKGKDYTNVVLSLRSLMAAVYGVNFMRNRVPYQSFEDIRDFQGKSDSCGKLLALNLPDDLTDKTVLDVGCNTGYFSIRCAQRGAKVVGLDIKRGWISTASRLANAVYRCPSIRFYHCDFFDWQKPWLFDYILAVNILPAVAGKLLIDKAMSLLKPDGKLVIETPLMRANEKPDVLGSELINAYTGFQYIYPNEKTFASWCKGVRPIYRCRSIRTPRTDLCRHVYHLSNQPLVVADVPETFRDYVI